MPAFKHENMIYSHFKRGEMIIISTGLNVVTDCWFKVKMEEINLLRMQKQVVTLVVI